MAQETPDIRVLVGVKGGASIDGKSGQLIAKELAKIASDISKSKTLQVAFNLDTQLTKKNITNQLNKIVKSINITPISLSIQSQQLSNNSVANIEIEKTIAKKKSLEDLTAQKKKDIEATKQQEKAVKDYIKAIQLIGSNTEEKLLNQSENAIGKYGRTDLLSQFEKLKAESSQLKKDLSEIMGSLSVEDFSKKLVDPNAANEFKLIAEKVTDYTNALKQLKETSSVTSDAFTKDLRNADNGKLLDNLILKVTKFEAVNNKFKNNSGLASEFERIKIALKGLKTSGNFSKVDIDKLDRQFAEFKTNVVSLGQEGQTAFGKIRSQMGKLGVYFGASAVMMGTWRQIKQMTTNVIELDTAMTELKKVTNETDAIYSKFLNNAEVRAKNLGATLVDTVNATADFSRLGYSLKEAESISDAALVYKNVGDGINDINEASQSVISTIKAFHIEASQAMSIVDRFNEVGKLAHAA